MRSRWQLPFRSPAQAAAAPQLELAAVELNQRPSRVKIGTTAELGHGWPIASRCRSQSAIFSTCIAARRNHPRRETEGARILVDGNAGA